MFFEGNIDLFFFNTGNNEPAHQTDFFFQPDRIDAKLILWLLLSNKHWWGLLL